MFRRGAPHLFVVHFIVVPTSLKQNPLAPSWEPSSKGKMFAIFAITVTAHKSSSYRWTIL